MSKTNQFAWASFFVLAVLALKQLVGDGGGILPVPEPASPFPADGFYLLLSSESAELTGLAAVANAASIREEPGLERRWFDYDKKAGEPWNAALRWAEEKSNRKPYFVARHGSKAAEGLLAGSLDDQLATVTAALERLR